MLRERRRAANNKPNRRLDRKSSRGMIYENEELRLRTININAEVERGQSDMRKLRRENDQLRRDMWALRDEYDRMDKLLTAHRKGWSRGRWRGSESGNSYMGSENGHSSDEQSCSDDNVSCEECQGLNIDDRETSDNTKNNQKTLTTTNSNASTTSNQLNLPAIQSAVAIKKDNLHVNFDHLSIVSEESNPNSPIDLNSGQSPLSPLTELQSVWPPLRHFENLSYEKMGPSVDADGNIHHQPGAKPPIVPIPPPQEVEVRPHPPLKPPIKPKPTIFAPLRLRLPPRKEPIYATINRSPRIHLPQPQSPSTFQMGGNLEDLLKDLSLPETPAVDELCRKPDIIVIQSDGEVAETKLLESKKHRSEISVTLDFNKDIAEESGKPLEPPQAKIGFEHFFPDSIEIENPVDQPPSKNTNGYANVERRLSPVVDLKKKTTRRVSLNFNNPIKKSENIARRASIDVVTPTSEAVPIVLRRHNSHTHSHHRGPRSSHDSLRPTTSNVSTKSKRSVDEAVTTAEHTRSSVTSHDSHHHHHHHHHRRSLSRESSASIATQKSRRISITSHGGKIPWCGCWGNGCL